MLFRSTLGVEEVGKVGGQINDIIFGLGTLFGGRRTSRPWPGWRRGVSLGVALVGGGLGPVYNSGS